MSDIQPGNRPAARKAAPSIRRLAATTLMQPTLDANYEAVKSDTYVWKAR